MKKIEFRHLKANEVDVRVGTNKPDAKGASLLLYKDARCDMNILDETVGQLGWQREHSRDNANCTVSIYDEDTKQWISKEDTGTESNTEKAKGLASDSFKRACFNWGIGRELYTAPFIWIPRNVLSFEEIKYARFNCDSIGYDNNGQINHLIISKDSKVIYQLGKKEYTQEEDTQELRIQKAITSAMSTLTKEVGSKENAIQKIGMSKDEFNALYKTEPLKLWEIIQSVI